jgi:hypothetical protein
MSPPEAMAAARTAGSQSTAPTLCWRHLGRAASPSGSTAIRCARRRTAAFAAVRPSKATTRRCRSEPSPPATPGFIRACWSGWHAARQAEATDALEAMGIATPAGFPNDFDKKGGA